MMTKSTNKMGSIAVAILLSLPIINLIINALSLVAYGLNIPLADDWRKYYAGTIGHYDLEYLLIPENNTLYPIGKLLDSLAFYLLNGNTVAYQLTTLTLVLSGILAAQWKLLKSFASSTPVAACAFSLTLLTLQPESYWGGSDMGYHQAIPLLCLLASMVLLSTTALQPITLGSCIFVAGIVAGFSYISGAFAFAAFGAALLLVAALARKPTNIRLYAASIGALASSFISIPAQLYTVTQHKVFLPSWMLAYPWQSDFWMFFLGKTARSLFLPQNFPAVSLPITVIAVIVVGIMCFRLLKALSTNPDDVVTVKASALFIPMVTTIALYLAMISAGRAHLHFGNISGTLGYFEFGFYRFHYFWVTILWPWVALFVIEHLHRKILPRAITAEHLAIIMAVLAIITASNSSIFEHKNHYQAEYTTRINGLYCLRNATQNNLPPTCSRMTFPDKDITKQAINYAQSINASFVDLIVPTPPSLGTAYPAAFFRYSVDNGTGKWFGIENSVRPQDVLTTTNNDAQYVFPLNKSASSQCIAFDLAIRMRIIDADKDNLAYLFYLPKDGTDFSGKYATSATVKQSNDWQTIYMTVSSQSGFEPTLRFDPMENTGKIQIGEIEVRCRKRYLYDEQ